MNSSCILEVPLLGGRLAWAGRPVHDCATPSRAVRLHSSSCPLRPHSSQPSALHSCHRQRHHLTALAHSSSWDAWGSDSEDAEEDLLAELAAKSQKAAQAAATLTVRPAPLPQHGQHAISSQLATPAARQLSTTRLQAPPQLQRPAPATTNLLFTHSGMPPPTSPSSIPAAPGLHAPLKPQVCHRFNPNPHASRHTVHLKHHPQRGMAQGTSERLLHSRSHVRHCSAEAQHA